MMLHPLVCILEVTLEMTPCFFLFSESQGVTGVRFVKKRGSTCPTVPSVWLLSANTTPGGNVANVHLGASMRSVSKNGKGTRMDPFVQSVGVKRKVHRRIDTALVVFFVVWCSCARNYMSTKWVTGGITHGLSTRNTSVAGKTSVKIDIGTRR